MGSSGSGRRCRADGSLPDSDLDSAVCGDLSSKHPTGVEGHGDVAQPVHCDEAASAADTSEILVDREVGRALQCVATQLHQCGDSSSELTADDHLSVAGGRHGAGGVVSPGSRAGQRAVTDPALSLEQLFGKSFGRVFVFCQNCGTLKKKHEKNNSMFSKLWAAGPWAGQPRISIVWKTFFLSRAITPSETRGPELPFSAV